MNINRTIDITQHRNPANIFRSVVMFKLLFTVFAVISAGLLASSIKAAPNVDIDKIIKSCYDYLDTHLCEGHKWGMPFRFYRPSLEKYTADQWLWDSGAHMIVWSQKKVEFAVLDMRTMLQMQQEDGRIPEQIYWSNRTAKEDAELLLMYSNTKFTDTTQMPVLPFSLRAIYQASGDKEHVEEFLYPLVNYFKWWRSTRDAGDGLVTVIHNWESGLDASPAYDPAFHVYVTEVNQSSWAQVYPKFIEIIESYKLLYQWNVSDILARETAPDRPAHLDTWFKVKDLALNCVYAAGWRVLSELAAEIGDTETADYCASQASLSSAAIQTRMWDAEHSSFQTVYTDFDGVDKFSLANSIQNLFPLLLSDLPSEQVDALVAQLSDTNKFAALYSVPTVAMDDPQFCATFDADLMWRGPVWGFTNWFILEGLGLHSRLDVQERILTSWVSLVDKSGIYEHYNPLTGEAYGAVGLGMSTLVCDWIYRYGWDRQEGQER